MQPLSQRMLTLSLRLGLPIVDELIVGIKCPCCRSAEVVKTNDQKGADGRLHEIGLCMNCTSTVNASDLRNSSEAFQRFASIDFFATDDAAVTDALKEIDGLLTTIDYYMRETPHKGRAIFLDYGAGRGLMAAAAAQRFEKVYALELNIELLESFHPHLPNRERIIPIRSLKDMGDDQVDVVCLWHVAEHLPDIRGTFEDIKYRMRPGGTFLFQVPMFQQSALCESHYTFLNRIAIRTLCDMVGLHFVNTYYYSEEHMITALASNRP